MRRRWPGVARNLARRRRQGAAGGAAVDTVCCATRAARPARRRRPGQGGAGRRSWSTSSASAARSRRGWPSSAATTTTARRLQADQARHYIADAVDSSRKGRSASSPSPATIVDGKAGPGTRRRRQHRRGDRAGPARRRAQGAGRAGRQPGGSVAGVGAHPPGAAGRQGPEDPGRGVDGQCRRVGRLLGRDRRAITSSPSPRPSPDRSACSASCRASRATLAKLGLGADGMKTTPLSGEPDMLEGPVARSRPR